MLPSPTHRFINWFFDEDQKKSLVLKPKYQRNPVWSESQRCFLIDSILNDIPIGMVYLNLVTVEAGPRRKTQYEVVDGQQRLKTILDFMNNIFALKRIPRTYPVSSGYQSVLGKKYSSLSSAQQDRIWHYPVAVQELRQYSEDEIKTMFRRLNYVVERLNKQELRHSQYFGEFMKTVEALSIHHYWEDWKLFSPGDFKRMKDVEFVSELFIIVIDGVQHGQKTIDEFFAKFDSGFPRKFKYVHDFETTLARIAAIPMDITETRFTKKADFYGLFAAVNDLLSSSWPRKGLRRVAQKLRQLSKALDKRPATFRGTVLQYYGTVIEGPNKIAKRKKRQELIRSLIENAIGA